MIISIYVTFVEKLPLSILYLKQLEISVMTSIIQKIISRVEGVTSSVVEAEETHQRRPLLR